VNPVDPRSAAFLEALTTETAGRYQESSPAGPDTASRRPVTGGRA
jgi:hypothetical protein